MPNNIYISPDRWSNSKMPTTSSTAQTSLQTVKSNLRKLQLHNKENQDSVHEQFSRLKECYTDSLSKMSCEIDAINAIYNDSHYDTQLMKAFEASMKREAYANKQLTQIQDVTSQLIMLMPVELQNSDDVKMLLETVDLKAQDTVADDHSTQRREQLKNRFLRHQSKITAIQDKLNTTNQALLKFIDDVDMTQSNIQTPIANTQAELNLIDDTIKHIEMCLQ